MNGFSTIERDITVCYNKGKIFALRSEITTKGGAIVEDRTFDLLTKMYSEFTNTFSKMDQRLGTLETGFDEMNEKMDSLNGHVIRLENKQNIDSKALFDGYKQIYENTVEMKSDFKAIKEILMEHEIRLRKVK